MKQDAPFSARWLRRVLCPVMAILVALAVTVNCGMLSNVSTLNDMFGRGTRTVVAVDPGADQEAVYYQQLWSSKAESLPAATAVVRAQERRASPPVLLRHALPLRSGLLPAVLRRERLVGHRHRGGPGHLARGGASVGRLPGQHRSGGVPEPCTGRRPAPGRAGRPARCQAGVRRRGGPYPLRVCPLGL